MDKSTLNASIESGSGRKRISESLKSQPNSGRRSVLRRLLSLGAIAGAAGLLLGELPDNLGLRSVHAADGSDLVIGTSNAGNNPGAITILNSHVNATEGFLVTNDQAGNFTTALGGDASTTNPGKVYGVVGSIEGPGLDALGLGGFSTPAGQSAAVYGHALAVTPGGYMSAVLGVNDATSGPPSLGPAGLGEGVAGVHTGAGIGVYGLAQGSGGVGGFFSGTTAIQTVGNVGLGVSPSAILPPSSGGSTLQAHVATNENFVSRDANIALGQPPGTFTGVSFQGVNDANTANNMLAFIGSPIVLAGGNVSISAGPPSGLPTHQIDVAGGAFCTGSSWVNASDRSLKENFTPLDENEVLQRLERVPIQKWNYKGESKTLQHIGPVAQDFYAAFEVGDDDKSINTVDTSGVAFAAIKALHKTVKELRGENEKVPALKQALNEMQEQFKNENKKLQERIAILEQTVKQFTAS